MAEFAATAHPTGRPQASGRILVADDNAETRDYVTRLLQARWPVETVADGQTALAAIRRERPAVVLTEVIMPGIGGLELVQRVRADPATCALPVIMLSARAGEEARIEGFSAGADDYLIKPFSARELVARVGTQVELLRLRAHAATEHERLLTLLGVGPAAIAVVRGPSHVYEMANDVYFRLVGRDDIVGTPGREALPELIAQGVWDLFDQVFATGTPHIASNFLARLDRVGTGTLDEVFVDFALQPLKDARGAVDGILMHAIEITDRVIARRAIDEARRVAETANRAKDEFLAMLGHELRNPLAPIVTALQLMNLRGDDSAVKERAVIDRQVRHLIRLVDDLLDVSRIARGQIELRKQPVELAEVVARAIEMAGPLLEERQQNLSVDVARTDLTIAADLSRLAQVIMNLLTNAAKYTEPRGHVHVRARRDGDQVEVSVRDTGIGISPDMLPKVFDIFAQEAQALDRAHGGLGLGLTIVRSLVDLHGGTVEARSEGLGRGSEFIVRLPAIRLAGPRSSTERTIKTQRRGARRVKTGRPLRVLIVDDNRDAAHMIADALDGVGHTTHIAHDGPSALTIAARFSPDVALLDLGLPLMDGYELAERLRAQNDQQAPVLVAVTGYGQEADRQRSRTAGFSAHIVKPVDLDALNGVLERLAREHLKSGSHS